MDERSNADLGIGDGRATHPMSTQEATEPVGAVAQS